MITLKSLAAPETAAADSAPANLSASGSMTAHVLTAASVGGGLATMVEWGIQTFGHVQPPTQVDDAVAAICIFAASLLLRKIAA